MSRPEPEDRDELWAMDFMHDTLASGEAIRVLTAIDVHSRECVALVAARGFTGHEVGRTLSEVAEQRSGLPGRIAVDNGSEFTSKALDHWAYWNRVELDFSRPGKPADNPFIEAFNSSLRRECLSQHWFLSVADAQRQDYNNIRPHSSLGDAPPAQFGVGGCSIQDGNQLQKSQP